MGISNKTATSVAATLLCAASFVLGAGAASAQPAWIAPPAPSVRPHLPSRVELDVDNNRVDDRLDRGIGKLRSQLAREKNQQRREELAADLAAPRRVELVFTEPVTQKQIDDFLALGGRIQHLYRSISFGWSGSIAGSSIDALSSAMGPDLLVVADDSHAQLHMDEATRTGRIRPIWAPGFAGHGGGLSGTSDITIGIIDTGVDDSHTDLAGRMEFWEDYTADNEASPRDIIQHGSHVAGIALGTGAAFGIGPGTLRYTDSGDLTGVPSNSFYLSGIHVPAESMNYQMSSTWQGGGSTILRLAARTNGVGGGFIAICSSATAGSPLPLNCTSTGNVTQMYSTALAQNSSKSLGRYATTVAVSTYPAVGDGFAAFRGVAPGTRWAGAKVFTNSGFGTSTTIGAGLDDLVAKRSTHDIKIVNMSLGIIGNPGLDPTLRAKANSAVNNGVVVVATAGNDGPGTSVLNVVDDPGRASLVITVGASNDANELTEYSSSGFSSPGSDEDMKPDLLAPGGSDYYSQILSVDSNDADAESTSFSDRVANDYLNIKGTSMSAPFVAGAAALVIDAMQKGGTTWTFSSAVQPLLVKMLLCASSTETNANREANRGTNPSLGRAAAPKDIFEGYGIMNPDAAVEAVSLVYSGGTIGGGSDGGVFDRRAWGRRIGITSGPAVQLDLTVPTGVDYDLYLYSGTPDAKGNPVIVASSTNAGEGADESLSFTPTSTEPRYLFVKRVSGAGDWSLSSGSSPHTCGDGSKTGPEECDDGNTASGDCCSSSCTIEANGSPCNDGKFCTASDTCSAGVCTGSGNPCAGGGECNNSCNESADNCAVPAGTPCSGDSNPCTLDQCNGQGSCSHPAGNAGTVCRASAGACDVQETCNGSSPSCPGNAFVPGNTLCRASAGVCDQAEFCTGNSASCPADGFASGSTPCRASAGVCDVAETCTGTSATCPANTLATTATVCRGSSGVCDAAERCNGVSASCPNDVFASPGTVCRASGGACDAAETCTGSSASCPADSLAPSTTVCRAASGGCDVAEKCTGLTASCPIDLYAVAQTPCRASAGVCDTAESCSGLSPNCPADSFAASSTTCRGSAGVCDVAEKCTGSSASCPANGYASSATVCRASGGVCDIEETCSGSSASCGSDQVVSGSVTCRASVGECDAAERCDGQGKTCPADGFAEADTPCSSDGKPCTRDVCSGSSASCTHPAGNAGTTCRASVGVCDVAETCNGSSTTCPADGYAGGNVVCRAANGVCDIEETCSGASPLCPGDSVSGGAVTCRGVTGVCDTAEVCNGVSKSCPVDKVAPGSTVCRGVAGVCDVEEKCNGVSKACPADGFVSAATTCRQAASLCDVQESCTGSSAHCPADAIAGAGTTCRASAGVCDVAETCNGINKTCGADLVKDSLTPCTSDGNECTNDVCDGTTVICRHNNNNAPCDDGEFCNGVDTCSGGECAIHAGDPCSGEDGDGNCSESCNENADTCTAPDPNGSSCSDGLTCTTGDTCQSGSCVPAVDNCGECGDGSLDDGELCDDGNQVNSDCCSNACIPAGNGTPCNDGQFCNGADTCQAGACTQHAGDPCTGADGDGNCSETCNEASDACNAADPDASPCDDGKFCNGSDTCQSGQCSQHAGDPCPGADGDGNCAESCRESNDTCTAADPNSSPCQDGLFCNGADSCQSGQCNQHAGDPCQGEDGDSNCSESCNEGADNCSGADPNGSACSDGLFCNGTDVCSSGQCTLHLGSPCPGADGDGNCTESCNEAADTCTAADSNGSACDDGLFCTVDDTCQGGVCSGVESQAPECSDTTTTTTTTMDTSTTTTLPPVTCGDPSGDGRISANDSQFTLMAAVGTRSCTLDRCDYSGDGKITTTDSLFILQVSVGQSIPPKCPPPSAALDYVTSTLGSSTTTTMEGVY